MDLEGNGGRRGAATAAAVPERIAERVPDERLVARALAGDRSAFEALVRRHQTPLVNHLYRLIGSRDAALDLAQDVFIKVYTSLASFDPRYRFTTWLYRIASNCAIDQLRRKQIPTFSLEPAFGDLDTPDAESRLAGSGPDPDQVLRLRELQGRLDTAIQGLPPAYRELILLRHRQHCRYDEIARITRLPIGTVKNRIFRAREILRESLADLLAGEASA
ncbi:MAG TPA: sigma-70 family RNA polymerase sigma factor [Candidatus Polarisedimenticolaceae bacterium]|nr:sigma-70 family RNA polymerase sigma factor [Candidatus Polarisedimenticolaceae bacterium]